MIPLARLATGLHDSLARTAGVLATYSRGSAAVELTVVMGLIDDVDYGLDEASLVVRTWSVVLRSADLVLNGEPTVPQIGDRIEVRDDNATTVYTVTNRVGERCFRYSDPTRQLIRAYAIET